MDVWLLSADYFFSSQLQGNLQRLGHRLNQIDSGDKLLEKITTGGPECVVLIDLSLPKMDFEIVSQMRAAASPPKAIVAFGPHVAEDKLKSAEAAGCDQVLTRGQAHRELGTVVQYYADA